MKIKKFKLFSKGLFKKKLDYTVINEFYNLFFRYIGLDCTFLESDFYKITTVIPQIQYISPEIMSIVLIFLQSEIKPLQASNEASCMNLDWLTPLFENADTANVGKDSILEKLLKNGKIENNKKIIKLVLTFLIRKGQIDAKS